MISVILRSKTKVLWDSRAATPPIFAILTYAGLYISGLQNGQKQRSQFGSKISRQIVFFQQVLSVIERQKKRVKTFVHNPACS